MLIDTMAEAIWNEHGRLEGGTATADWQSADADVRERFTRYAKAALAAIARPTPPMLKRGNLALQTWEHSEHYRSPVDGIYHAMIAAELPAAEQTPRAEIDDL